MSVLVNNLHLFIVQAHGAEVRALTESVALALVVVILITFIRVRLSPAFKQRHDQVAVRAPGERTLGAPIPALPFGEEDIDFALLSQVAYDATPEGMEKQEPGSRDAAADLVSRGWKRWPPFGEAQGLPEKLEASHLRVEVWVHHGKNSIAVAFAGTVFTNVKDWISNLRWFIPFHEDEYTETVHVFGPAFVNEFVTKIRPTIENPVLFSTGHSLGGGLAQQLAYALPACPFVPRVRKVFAFDPSPVTGYFSVSRTLRQQNKQGLFIDRIYERGEILAYIRSITNFIHEPSSVNAAISHIRYSLFKGRNPVYRHSIREFTEKLWRLVNSIP